MSADPRQSAVAVRRHGQGGGDHRRLGRLRRGRGARAGGCGLQAGAGRGQGQGAGRDRRRMPRGGRARSRRCNTRPSSEADCDAIVARRSREFGRLDILVVASGMNKVAKIDEMTPETFPRRDGRQRDAELAAGARRDQADEGAGRGRQDRADVLGARAARPSGGLHRLLRLEVGGRWHHQGARLRAWADRHHRQRDCADGVPLAADGMDVRGHRERPERAQGLSCRACRRGGWASRKIWPGRCCSSPQARRISTPATSSTPMAATRRGRHERDDA